MPRIHEFPNMAFQFSIDVFFMTYERSTPTRVRASSYWLLRTNCDLTLPCSQWYSNNSLTSAMMGVFTPQKLASVISKALFSMNPVVKYVLAHNCMKVFSRHTHTHTSKCTILSIRQFQLTDKQVCRMEMPLFVDLNKDTCRSFFWFEYACYHSPASSQSFTEHCYDWLWASLIAQLVKSQTRLSNLHDWMPQVPGIWDNQEYRLQRQTDEKDM